MTKAKRNSIAKLITFGLMSAGAVTTRNCYSEVIPKDIIVMITAYDATEKGRYVRESGAGIVVSQTSDGTAILTACHVVLPEKGSEMKYKVEVKFKGSPRSFVATVEESFCNPYLDYTVVFIDTSKTPPTIPQIAAQSEHGLLSEITQDEINEKFTVIGFAGGRDWNDKVLSVKKIKIDQIQFLEKVEPGASGGGIFDKHGRLVAMMRASDAGGAYATPIGYLIQKITEAEVTVNLKLPGKSVHQKAVDVCATVDPPIDPCLFRK